MERKIGSGILFTPVLYALFILIFLFLHFTQFEDFSRQMKNVSYHGTMTSGRGIKPSEISHLAVASNGLEMNFSSRAPLSLITEDNIKRDLYLQKVNRVENSLQLEFKYDTFIRFTSDPLSNNSSVEFSIPKTVPPVVELQLSTEAYAPFQLTMDDENRYMLTDGTSSFFLDMDQDFKFNPRKKILTISMKDRTSTTLALEDEAPGLGRTVREWLAEDNQVNSSQYRNIINQYRLLAYNGWKSRFDKNLGEWSLPNGKSQFDEKALVQHISASLKNNEYSMLLPDLLKAAEKNSEKLSWYSAPFTGDIVNKGAPLLRGNPHQLLNNVETLPITGNPESSPYREIMELKALLNDPEAQDYDAWIEENLYPLIVWLEEGLFIFHPENPISDTLLNLQASDMLIKVGEQTANEKLILIGQKIIASLLAKADENGFLPKQIIFSRERASQGEGYLKPEEIISLFPDPEYSPRIIDISEQAGEGSWLYTAAKAARVQSIENALNIDLYYPKGQIHHVILRGIDPFDRIILHGIQWKSDPRFQRYSDGWVYDSVNRTLYVKIRQRASRESISIQKALPEESSPVEGIIPETEGTPGDPQAETKIETN